MQGIYKILNEVNGKSYIGSSKNLENRLNRHHKSLLRTAKHWNTHLQSAWNTYGQHNFIFSILEEVSDESMLAEREQYWIDYYKSADREYGYNIAPKANRSEISPETTAKRLETRGDKYKGENAPMYGKSHSEEAKKKIQAYQKGRPKGPMSDETKQKLGQRTTGKTYEELYGLEVAQALKSKKCMSYEEKYGAERAKEIRIKQSSIFVSEELRKEICTCYIQNDYHILKWMIDRFGISKYKITQILKEEKIYGCKASDSLSQGS